MNGCPKCGGTLDDDGNCRFSDCVNDSKDGIPSDILWGYCIRDARIAALEAELYRARLQHDCADAGRVIAWAKDPIRKTPNTAFPAGPEREAAYWIEWARAPLEAVLAKAEEALEEAYQPYGSHFIGDGCGCLACRYKRSRQALAAIREVK